MKMGHPQIRLTTFWKLRRVAPRPGIAPEDVPKLFSRYFQVERSSRPSGQGLGLGLFIAKEIITAHNGTIEVSSELERGTTFTIHLPLVQD